MNPLNVLKGVKVLLKGVKVPKDVAQKITYLSMMAVKDREMAKTMLENAFNETYREMDRTEFLAFMILGTLGRNKDKKTVWEVKELVREDPAVNDFSDEEYEGAVWWLLKNKYIDKNEEVTKKGKKWMKKKSLKVLFSAYRRV
jgi:hypothetical protein